MADPLSQTLDLVRRAKAGDTEALNALFQRYYERVRRSVRGRLGPGLRAYLESGDILQQTFAKAFENFDRYAVQNEAGLLDWLEQYAEHQIRDEARRWRARKRRPTAELLSLDGSTRSSDATPEVAGQDTGPLDQAKANELRGIVAACVHDLPEAYRQVIVLREFEGLPWRDVAQRLGKSTESAARELFARARAEVLRMAGRRGIHPRTRPGTD